MAMRCWGRGEDMALNPRSQIPNPKSKCERSWDLGLGAWVLGFSHASACAARRLELLESLFDQALVVLLRHVSLEELRGDVDRDVDRFLTDLLQGARRLHLDLALRVAHQPGRLGPRLILHLFPEPVGVGPAPRDDFRG